jgi:hypothetical protein
MSNEGKKKTLTSTPLPSTVKNRKKKLTCTFSLGAPFPPSHNDFGTLNYAFPSLASPQ